ncbi:branched-chain amino acid aminotransferase [Steroidobacter sp. S1-65]|uniref:Branched-chain-amino-acid aminotransferase n=1 Tax=Steroidobacter gossypii TaxID=2805490 RepID=A0ABS1WV05_9GAMM|nr:branched-chain amino acid aminotransferase [Steroidobacter gossypii]MBM0104803.1 branched-chain amino acid aminotransferase [Steroidobacter gossypii]
MQTPKDSAAARAPFGTVLAPTMAVARFQNGQWQPAEMRPTGAIELHPAAHVLHYASTCFEGFKAYRWADGSINLFRVDRHIERMRQSARSLILPEPDAKQLAEMIHATVRVNHESVPEAPGALYLRPVLFGTSPNIGAAGTPSEEALLVVLASPVWDYFGLKPLRIFVDDAHARSATLMGSVKTGGNYAAALGPTLEARRRYQSDQVLFAPGGEVQETGAANFVLIRKGKLLTRKLDSAILHGVTRDSLLTLAKSEGYEVEERAIDVREMLDWVRDGEAALSGTAAVLAGVGVLIHKGEEHRVGNGEVGEITKTLRAALVAMQRGETPDRFGWSTPVVRP